MNRQMFNDLGLLTNDVFNYPPSNPAMDSAQERGGLKLFIASFKANTFNNKNLEAVICNKTSVCFEKVIAEQIILAQRGIRSELTSVTLIGTPYSYISTRT